MPTPTPLAALEWSRPWALVLAAVLPVALLALARLRARPPRVATGALAIWRALAAPPERVAARAAWRPPLGVWLLAAALALGALALAGPRLAAPAASSDVVLLVDPSPSVHLAWCAPAERAAFDPARPLAPPATPTRLARAVERAVRALDERGVPAERRVWTRALPAGAETARGARPPAARLAAPRAPLPAPPWSAWDRADTWWITDRAPAVARDRAALVAAGGGAAPGPIAVAPAAPKGDDEGDDGEGDDGGGAGAAAGRATLLVWTGAAEAPPVALERALPPARVAVDGALPEVLRAVVAAWAGARGHAPGELPALAPDASGAALPLDTGLVVRGHAGGPAQDVALARDGWRAAGRVAEAGVARLRARLGAGARPWLTAAPGARPVVVAAPGRVDTALVALAEPAGDPAAFAVSWAELLDALLLPPAGVVPLAERRAAGAPRSDLPAASAPATERGGEPGGEPGGPWVPLLALAGALVAAVGLAALAGGPRRPGRAAPGG